MVQDQWRNFTGRRLYWFLGHYDLRVTNACRELVSGPTNHGTPDPIWLAENLRKMTYGLLLLCGKVAQQTYDQCGYRPTSTVLKLPHPAARLWTRELLDQWQKKIQRHDVKD